MSRNPWLLSGEIFGVVSAPDAPPRGSGKSLVALQLSIEQAEYLNYDMCFNFDIDLYALYYYCRYRGFHNVIRKMREGKIYVRPVVNSNGKSDLTKFISSGNCVYVCDEMGIFASAEKWQYLSDKFKADLALCRKYGIRLWWIAQYYEQVAKVLRQQSNYIIECSSILKSSPKLGGTSKILMKIFYVFSNKSYEALISKDTQWSGIKLFFKRFSMAFRKKYENFSLADELAFQIYNSFGKIGDNPRLRNPVNFLVTEAKI